MARVRVTSVTIAALAFMAVSDGPARAQQVRVLELGQGIYQAVGSSILDVANRTGGVIGSNTFLISTSAGNVIIDTSSGTIAETHKRALTEISRKATKAIILTHAHADHTGGVGLWREVGTEIITQRNHREFVGYQRRLAGFFGRRNAAQFGRAVPFDVQSETFEPSRTFDRQDTIQVGDVVFELIHTPGETPDHLTVWIPQLKTAFIGDNYYQSFPNLYTLRGTQPRWALDYVESLNTVLRLEPELVLPSHGQPIRGRDEVRRRLTQYRDAILYVHDATVKGMNEGKDVYMLMREIRLPPALDVGESYGKVTWSIRGIYEGYAGWFDGNPSTMYGSPRDVYADVVQLAGGAEAVARRAAEAIDRGEPVRALYLTDIVLATDGRHRPSLEARLRALQRLDAASTNSNERGWLQAGIRDVQARLK